MVNTANGNPTKNFFVDMITRDISLEDCILDLLDNCLDGARHQARELGRTGKTPLAGFRASVDIDSKRCRVVDNCGGIPRNTAERYAFRFGRADEITPEKLGIGLYGVGMKRAIFKLGKVGVVHSRLGTSAFDVKVDVEEWRQDEKTWDFPITDSQVTAPIGATVEISPLWNAVATVVGDPNFAAGLRETVARDYAFLIGKGFQITLNGRSVQPYVFAFRRGSGFAPMRTVETVSGVTIEVFAGFAEYPPMTTEAESESVRPHDPSGWYILCNDRVVLAADKTSRTVWGRDGFSRWHPQYRGILGIVRLSAADPRLLPWTTTKRDIDETSAVYRAAVEKMKSATERCIKYTSARRGDSARAEALEEKASPVPALNVAQRTTPLFPRIVKKRKKGTRITYSVTQPELYRALALLRDPGLSNKEVGLRTFRFFLENAE